jgi:hypothetical protein
MGFWGASLYSGDFAMDLRSAVAAVARLPLPDTDLVEALRGTERSAADDPDDPDHTTFWLVLADQLAHRGIYPGEVRDRVLAIINEGSDLERLRSLGANQADLRKRQVKLLEIKAALVEAAPRNRKTLARPQPLVMATGEVFAYPTSSGKPINPYFKSKAVIPGWCHDGWGVLVAVETGHVFGYLAWFRTMTLDGARSSLPGMASLWSEPLWALRRAGTCSPLHFRRMELQRIGSVSVDHGALTRLFPDLPSPRTAAIIDKSIANHLNVGPEPALSNRLDGRRAWIHGLDQVAHSITQAG